MDKVNSESKKGIIMGDVNIDLLKLAVTLKQRIRLRIYFREVLSQFLSNQLE